MDPDAARDFIRQHHRGVLVTFRKDGTPTTSPVTPSVDDEGFVVVSTRQTAMKTAHVRRDPRAVLCVFTDAFYGDWVQVSGSVQVLDLPEAMEPLVAYYRSVAGEHPDWDEYRQAMQAEQRCLLRISVDHTGPSVQG